MNSQKERNSLLLLSWPGRPRLSYADGAVAATVTTYIAYSWLRDFAWIRDLLPNPGAEWLLAGGLEIGTLVLAYLIVRLWNRTIPPEPTSAFVFSLPEPDNRPIFRYRPRIDFGQEQPEHTTDDCNDSNSQ